jgi:halimadienyl-diphosphate synthase
LHPCETFELLWAAYHRLLAGTPVARVLSRGERTRLRAALQDGGVSLSRTFPIPDADDTAVALLLLDHLGEGVDPSVLGAFVASDGSFASFPYERHTSVGVNAHVLHALQRVRGYPDADRTTERLLEYLVDHHTGLYWVDKWHISPLYATAHVACSVGQARPTSARGRALAAAVNRSREWLRRTQNGDGSWGFYGQPTLEETAYGLLALASRQELDAVDAACCAAADAYLETAEPDAQAFPPMWIDKCLYTPPRIVRAVIRAAREAYANRHDRRGRHHSSYF